MARVTFEEFWPTYVRAHSERNDTADALRWNVAGMGNPVSGNREARVVVDRIGALSPLCTGVDFALLCGRQQTGDVCASLVVVVGGS